MSTAETRMNPVKKVGRASRLGSNEAQRVKALCERLLREQPQSGPLLQRLLARSRQGAFAPIQDRRCSACNMTVASARIQKVSAGEFINCAHCAIFLYQDQRHSLHTV